MSGKVSEDFFFAEFAQGFALQSHSWNHGFFRFCFHGLSLHAFAAYTLRQKPSLDAGSEVAAGNITVVFCPSAPT